MTSHCQHHSNIFGFFLFEKNPENVGYIFDKFTFCHLEELKIVHTTIYIKMWIELLSLYKFALL